MATSDIVAIASFVIAGLSIYVGALKSVQWHTKWIKDKEAADEKRYEFYNTIIRDLEINQAKLTTMVEQGQARLDRLERQLYVVRGNSSSKKRL